MEFDPIAKIVLDSDCNPVPENFPRFDLNFLPHIPTGVRDSVPVVYYYISLYRPKSDYWLNSFSLQLLDDSSTLLAKLTQNGIKLNIPDLLLKHDTDIFLRRLNSENRTAFLLFTVTKLARILNTNPAYVTIRIWNLEVKLSSL